MYVGVTYENIRAFKWIRNITDASVLGNAAIKITSTNQPTYDPSTPIYNGTN